MAHSNLGGALSDAGRFDEAIRACREAIRLNPDSPEAHGNLGRALLADRANWTRRSPPFVKPCASNPAAVRRRGISPRRATGRSSPAFSSSIRLIDKHVVRLRSPRPFLQSLLDPRSPPMLRRHFVLNLLAAGVLASPAFAGKPRGTSSPASTFPARLHAAATASTTPARSWASSRTPTGSPRLFLESTAFSHGRRARTQSGPLLGDQ